VIYLQDGSRVLYLDGRDGLTATRFDPGYPEVRPVVTPRPDVDGTYDTSEHVGSRLVVLNLVGQGNKRQIIDDISFFSQPSRRPFVYYEMNGQMRRIRLRPQERSTVLTAPSNVLAEAQLAFVAPDGIIEQADATVLIAFATEGGEDGRTYDLTFDRDYAPTLPVGTVNALNLGSARACPSFRLFGPVANPEIQNLTSGEKLRFVTTLTDTQWLEIDCRNKTVRLNGLPDQNRYNTLDFADSEWIGFYPGDNLVRYTADTITGRAFARVSYRSSWY
jgi:hypothetical protein